MADFEKNHPEIAEQELWKLFVEKANEQGLDRDFISAVGEVCTIGLNLSKYIVRFFPTFTLHDETHSANVCRWMWVLLGERAKELTAHEAALLLMSACCHDIGMAVSPEQEERMRLSTYSGWDDYFRQNLKDDEEYEETEVISDQMLRNFVRMHHHERIGENLRQSDWPGILNRKGINRETLLKLCRSHGTELSRLELRSEPKFDLLLCAVLLRLADLLDYDTSRAPAVLFRHIGLDRPANAGEKRSAVEYANNQAGTFDETIANDVISYYAEYDNPQQEQIVQGYLDWVVQELKHCAEELAQTGSDWRSLRLPYRINTDGVVRNGYAAGKFCMTMDQDKVIDLLTGENLYSDPGVFVRELLQNSIDAVLMRAKQDPNFSLEDGLIQIDTWMDEEANTWFRIRDNGTGMNEHIIQNHFLKVGNSYYTSEEFQYANRHAPKGSYTAISRFGIGILSCFMGDKEHTQFKVSTKRFDEGNQCGIRLDVTGLHGYYFLCNEKDHSESENWFPTMPSQNKEDRGYRTEPGTTICVNANLLRMGEVRTIREIMDKYVQFPEVRVTYNGPDGYKEYSTQQELMEAVYALNSDGEVKEYVYELPDEMFANLKDTLPVVKWEEKPAVIIQYHPVEWLSDSEKMTGVAVTLDGCVVASCEEIVLKDWEKRERKITPKIYCTVSFRDISVVAMNFSLGIDNAHSYPEWRDRLEIMRNGIQFKFPIDDASTILSEPEQRVFSYLRNSIRCADARENLVVYNGVLASEREPLTEDGTNWNNAYAVVLLRDDFLPEVNLARNEITSFSPEAACCWAIAAKYLGVGTPEFLESDDLGVLTKQEFWNILECHGSWNELLFSTGVEETERGYSLRYGGSLEDRLRVAAWEMNKAISFDFVEAPRMHQLIGLTERPCDSETKDFPAGMFAWPEKDDGPFASMGWQKNLYNRSHPLSQWLVKNRKLLEEKVPAVYDTLIRAMMLWWDEEKICKTINTILDHLRCFDQNCFGIQDNLFLTEDEFVN